MTVLSKGRLRTLECWLPKILLFHFSIPFIPQRVNKSYSLTFMGEVITSHLVWRENILELECMVEKGMLLNFGDYEIPIIFKLLIL